MGQLTVLPTGELSPRPALCYESECALATVGGGFTEIEIGARFESTRLLIIGEASGEAEARDGLPFRPYAQSGSLLADAMREINLSRAEVAITNIVRCRPPKDWLEGAPWQWSAITHCTENYLAGAIERLKPRAILALGGTAFRALCAAPKGKYGGLDYARGYVHPGQGFAAGVPIVPTYHPAFIRRGSPHLTPLLQRDIRRAFQIATGRMREGEHFTYTPTEWGLRYQTAPTLAEAWAYADSLDPDRPLAFDIETPMSTRSDEDERTSFTDRDIKLFQCTQRRGEGIALPYRDEYVAVVEAILSRVNVRVGFNNWSFDDPVLRANGIDVGPTHDAMTMFGFYWSDLPKNLQAAAQSCGFPFPWKALGETELEFYGCADVDATLCVYEHMRKVLESEGMWESYLRYFAQLWPILRDMARRGIPIDPDRRADLRALIEREGLRVDGEIRSLVPAECLTTKQKNGLKRVPKSTEGLVQVEVVIEKDEKCSCLKKEREKCQLCLGSGILPSGSRLTRWAKPVEFNPNSSHQVKAFIRYLRHPVPKHQKRVDAATGEAADTTEMKELERLATKTRHPIYPLLIQKRQLTKVEGTYVDGWNPSSDGAVHTTYTFQTATWQTSSRSPNVQNGLKHGKTPFQKDLARGFNSMQRARSGRVLINFDFKSFHALTTAHDFNIPDYARLARIDIHSFVACHFLRLPERIGLWERDDDDMRALFKSLRKREEFASVRDVPAKQTILGIQFGRGPTSVYTMYKEFFDSLTQARAINEVVFSLFPRLKTAQIEVVARAADEKKLVNKFSAIRHFFDCRRWDRRNQRWVNGDQAEQAMAFLPASHAFGHLRDVLLRCEALGYPERFGFVNQIHDSIVAHCPTELRDECIRLVKAEMERPSEVLIYPKMAPDGFQVDADAAFGESLADLK